MRKRRSFTWGGDGCGFLLLSCLVSGCLLLMNGALVKAACVYLESTQGTLFAGDSWRLNVIGFTVPLLMLIAQWRLVDLISDIFSRSAEHQSTDNGASRKRRFSLKRIRRRLFGKKQA